MQRSTGMQSNDNQKNILRRMPTKLVSIATKHIKTQIAWKENSDGAAFNSYHQHYPTFFFPSLTSS